MKNNGKQRVLVWFSCGAASAVAAKYAVEKYPHAEILYCDTLKYEHEDNPRFMDDVARWVGKPIKLLKSRLYTDVYDVYRRTGWLIGVAGARCTTELKRKVRKEYEQPGDLQIFGLSADEHKRIDRFEQNNHDVNLEWVLRDENIQKEDCYKILKTAGIELPAMYRLGYNHNNCKMCVKGCTGFWNKVRVDFPDDFKQMAELEREMNVAICKSYVGGRRQRVFLDELDPNAGRYQPLKDIECGVLCVNEDTRDEAMEQLKQRLKLKQKSLFEIGG